MGEQSAAVPIVVPIVMLMVVLTVAEEGIPPVADMTAMILLGWIGLIGDFCGYCDCMCLCVCVMSIV